MRKIIADRVYYVSCFPETASCALPNSVMAGRKSRNSMLEPDTGRRIAGMSRFLMDMYSKTMILVRSRKPNPLTSLS